MVARNNDVVFYQTQLTFNNAISNDGEKFIITEHIDNDQPNSCCDVLGAFNLVEHLSWLVQSALDDSLHSSKYIFRCEITG
jgi:hypothetical protein